MNKAWTSLEKSKEGSLKKKIHGWVLLCCLIVVGGWCWFWTFHFSQVGVVALVAGSAFGNIFEVDIERDHWCWSHIPIEVDLVYCIVDVLFVSEFNSYAEVLNVLHSPILQHFLDI